MPSKDHSRRKRRDDYELNSDESRLDSREELDDEYERRRHKKRKKHRDKKEKQDVENSSNIENRSHTSYVKDQKSQQIDKAGASVPNSVNPMYQSNLSSSNELNQHQNYYHSNEISENINARYTHYSSINDPKEHYSIDNTAKHSNDNYFDDDKLENSKDHYSDDSKLEHSEDHYSDDNKLEYSEDSYPVDDKLEHSENYYSNDDKLEHSEDHYSEDDKLEHSEDHYSDDDKLGHSEDHYFDDDKLEHSEDRYSDDDKLEHSEDYYEDSYSNDDNQEHHDDHYTGDDSSELSENNYPDDNRSESPPDHYLDDEKLEYSNNNYLDDDKLESSNDHYSDDVKPEYSSNSYLNSDKIEPSHDHYSDDDKLEHYDDNTKSSYISSYDYDNAKTHQYYSGNDKYMHEHSHQLNINKHTEDKDFQVNNSSSPQEKQSINHPDNFTKNKFTNAICNAMVVSETLPICNSVNQTPIVTPGPVIIKVPVVLAEPKLTISIISSVKLEDDVTELKRIKKNVYLTQCTLLPSFESTGDDTGILFISGFIRKNIEYSTKEHSSKSSVSGKIKHTTVKVPFNCTVRVNFINRPIFTNSVPQESLGTLINDSGFHNGCDEPIIGNDLCEQTIKITEFFNEKVFCELVNVEIIETDILKNPTEIDKKSSIYQSFHEITEKVVLHLTVKLLQNQQVKIPR